MFKKRLDPELVKSLLRYENGKLYWKIRPTHLFSDECYSKTWNTKYANKEAGSLVHETFGDRYTIRIKGRNYYRSILVWVIHNNEWPIEDIDHKNVISTDDRIENLRLATNNDNKRNRKMYRNNSCGFKGVSKDGNRFRARIVVNYKEILLGYFADAKSAHECYLEAAKKYFGEFARG